jgi:hypothetical protein
MDLELIRPKIGIEGRCTTIPVVAIAWQSAMQAAVSRRHESRLVRHQADVGAGFGKREPAQKALNFLSIGASGSRPRSITDLQTFRQR